MANKETLELAGFLAEIANALEKSLRDGVLNFADFANFLNTALSAPNAIQGIDKIGEEIKGWTDAEKAQVIVLFQEKLDFAADNLESAVEDIFTAVVLLVGAITKLGLKVSAPEEGNAAVSE
jgi:hypothetical protein